MVQLPVKVQYLHFLYDCVSWVYTHTHILYTYIFWINIIWIITSNYFTNDKWACGELTTNTPLQIQFIIICHNNYIDTFFYYYHLLLRNREAFGLTIKVPVKLPTIHIGIAGFSFQLLIPTLASTNAGAGSQQTMS